MELETLLHEWGHSMQAFLSSTELQNFSGTRSYIDFVEAVSLLFEHFAWDHRFLSTFAKNYVTGSLSARTCYITQAHFNDDPLWT
jgi:intermediate peptidase